MAKTSQKVRQRHVANAVDVHILFIANSIYAVSA